MEAGSAWAGALARARTEVAAVAASKKRKTSWTLRFGSFPAYAPDLLKGADIWIPRE